MRNLVLMLIIFIFFGCAKQSYTLNELNLKLNLDFKQDANILSDTNLNLNIDNHHYNYGLNLLKYSKI